MNHESIPKLTLKRRLLKDGGVRIAGMILDGHDISRCVSNCDINLVVQGLAKATITVPLCMLDMQTEEVNESIAVSNV